MILTRAQVKQLRKIFKDDKGLEFMELKESGDNGIGIGIHAIYINSHQEQTEIDITDYENW